MGREKKHHFVPVSYLKRFTRSGTEDGDLWVFDSEALRSWKSTPLGSAHARDYNLIESEGVDPFVVEKDLFSTIEDAGARVFNRIEEQALALAAIGTGAITLERADIEELCLFMAAQTIRVPARREALDRFESELARRVAEVSAGSEELFESVKERHAVDSDFKIEDLRALLEDPDVEIKVEGTPTTHLAATLPSLVPVARVLTMRRWSVLLAPEAGPHYVTTDDPVALMPERLEPSFFGVGFGTPGSRVFFPISRRTLLLGDDVQPGHAPRTTVVVLPPDGARVPALNVAVIGAADRHVYSGEIDFMWLAPEGDVRDGAAFLVKARELRTAEGATPRRKMEDE